MELEMKPGGALRITLLTSCQSGCDFCHLEGHKTSQELRTLNPAIASWRETGRLSNLITLDEIDQTIEIAKLMNLNAINLTGGEPTLHPNINEIISKLNREGFSVAMTTHAEIPPAKLNQIINSGLDWIIISLHSTTPEEYLKMDLFAQQLEKKYSRETAIKYCEKKLKNKVLNIENCVQLVHEKKLSGIFTNTVILDVNRTSEIIRYCNRLGILPRIQLDLNQPKLSNLLLNTLISNLEAKCKKEYRAIGDSSGAGYDYEYLDPVERKPYRFRIKDFGEIYVNKMCDSCNKKGTSSCREKFYGIRLEHGKIRTCIDYEIEGKTIFSYHDFIEKIKSEGSIPKEISDQYSDALQHTV